MSDSTPGPWQAVYDKRKDRWHVACSTHVVVPTFKNEANAHLIAAAPDMLKALDAIIRSFKRPTAEAQNRGVHEMWRELVNISARAKGDEAPYGDRDALRALVED